MCEPSTAGWAMYVDGGARGTKGTREGDIAGRDETTSRGRGALFQELSASERAELQRWARRRTSQHRVVVRSRIVLLASQGLTFRAIAAALRVTPATVRLWVTRFARGRLAALTREAPGRGRRRGGSHALASAVLEATRAHVANRLTVRAVAVTARTSPSTVWRVWRRYGIGPEASITEVDAARAQLISETRPET